MIKKKTKIKQGRPPANEDPLGKYSSVYEKIPDDGQHIRFNDLVKILDPMSKQTISAALKYGCMLGLIGQEHHSHKHVEYYKIIEKTYFSTEATEQVCELMAARGMSELDQASLYFENIRPQARYKFLKKAKAELTPDFVDKTQAIFLKNDLSYIEEHVLKALMEYAQTSNKTAACDKYLNTLQFIIVPLLKTLPKYITDIGLNENVELALWKSRGRQKNLLESDFVDVNKLKSELNRMKERNV